MRGKLVEGRIDTRVKIHFAERALTAAPGGKVVEKSAAKPVIGKNAVKIGADHRAIGRDSTLRPAIQRQERPVAIRSAGAPRFEIVLVALLYGIGAHGIMTLNDFKALEGDRQTGVRSLPVTLGPEKAAKLACVIMLVPQAIVLMALSSWDRPAHAAILLVLGLGQIWAMSVLLKDPKAKAPWYNGTGVLMYIIGMMVSAFALRGLEVLP